MTHGNQHMEGVTMAKTEQVVASTLVKDFTLYPRTDVDSTHVSAMIQALETGVTLPPMLVEQQSLRIVDGFHRHAALQRVRGPDAEIDVILEAMTEAEIFERAMAANANHGRTFSPFDRARCIGRAEELGLERDAIAKALNMSRARVDDLYIRRYTADGQVLKRTMAHLAGKTATGKQMEANRRAGGMDQLFYIRQVIVLLESGAINWERPSVVDALGRLGDLLQETVREQVA